MRTEQGTDFVILFYAKQILTQYQINIDYIVFKKSRRKFLGSVNRESNNLPSATKFVS